MQKDYELIVDPKSFFRDLGEMHDTRLISLSWDLIERIFLFQISDINANFFGEEGYKGILPATLRFVGVASVLVNINPTESKIRIYAIEIADAHDQSVNVEFKLSPGGNINISCKEIRVHYEYP